MSQATPPLAGGALDRDAETRSTADLLHAAWAEPGAQLLRMRGALIPIVGADSAAPRLSLVPTDGSFTGVVDDYRAHHVYLGRTADGPMFGVLLDESETVELRAEETWQHPFQAAPQLREVERELAAVASGLLRWHESAQFSPRDGSPTTPAQGGWARHDAHGGEHFPRTDPAVIVLIEHNDRVLLGSNALWESGRFSLLAGFVETGESLEQTVRREVLEESGVRLGSVRYVTSQPWPFPRSLMLGFRAELADDADPEQLVPDPEEISELRWFTRDEVTHPQPGISLPGTLSIARWLLDAWVAEGDAAVAGEPALLAATSEEPAGDGTR